MKKNMTILADSYKISHHQMYMPGTDGVYSYFEARKGAMYPKVVFFGLQYALKEYLEGVVITREKIEEGARLVEKHLGGNAFNRKMWEHILVYHGGKLPVRIKAVPEGSVVDISNVLLTVENTDPLCAPLTNHLETVLSQIWAPCTVATQSYYIKETLKKYHAETGCIMNGIDFGLHDFAFRSVTSVDSAGICGAAHLVNFMGTDTIQAMVCAEEYYNANYDTLAFSVPACYDDQTEIFTEKGFIKFSDLSKDVKVAQYHENGDIDFVMPTNYVKDKYEGNMIHFYSGGYKYIDMMVTPNHRMVRKNKKNQLQIFEANSDNKFSDKNSVIVAGNGKGDKDFSDIDRLKIAFQADGSFASHADDYNGERGGCTPIRFSLKKERKKIRLEKILKSLKFEYTLSKYENDYYSFWIKVPKDINMQKDFSWVDFVNVSTKYAKQFINELSYWDGSSKNNCIVYSSIIKKNIDIVQALSCLCGKKCQVSSYQDKRTENIRQPIYSVIISDKDRVSGHLSKKVTVPYDGFVYCVSVPTTMLIVRRNGKVSVCGNSEHSVQTALGREGEEQVFEHLLNTYPKGILSVVIDSYDYKNFISGYSEKFKDKILARDGKLVYRPDSGNPVLVTLDVLNRLELVFGATANSAGYRELNPKVGMLWGDGINHNDVEEILQAMKDNKWAASNIVFGMGSGLLQKINRDDMRFAFKSSCQKRDGVWHDIFKSPLEGGKESKKGRLALIQENGTYRTVPEGNRNDQLVTVFENGEIKKRYTFDEVRANSRK